MTQIVGLVLAVLAGSLFSRAKAARWMIPPWAAAFAVQTVWLASGRGHAAASAVTNFPNVIGYVVVNLISFGLAAWLAVGLADWRSRRGAGDPPLRFARTALIASALTAATTLLLAISTAPAHPGHGGGIVEAMGMLSVLVSLLSGSGLAVSRRLARHQAGAVVA